MRSEIDIIKGIWNDKDDEAYRRDVCHWRGHGRWADDARWLNIGKQTLQCIERLGALAGRPGLHARSGLNVLEWGPGGGANAFALRYLAARYYGVDISAKNLAEAERVVREDGAADCFIPIALDDAPASVAARIEHPVSLFLSTAVFQHFPSHAYGFEVLATLRRVCADDALGFIQIRFDNGNEKYRSIQGLDEYERKHITANAYTIDAFWDAIAKAGFTPLAVTDIATSHNYATFYMQC